jgi:hypothetical protein
MKLQRQLTGALKNRIGDVDAHVEEGRRIRRASSVDDHFDVNRKRGHPQPQDQRRYSEPDTPTHHGGAEGKAKLNALQVLLETGSDHGRNKLRDSFVRERGTTDALEDVMVRALNELEIPSTYEEEEDTE